MPGDQDI